MGEAGAPIRAWENPTRRSESSTSRKARNSGPSGRCPIPRCLKVKDTAWPLAPMGGFVGAKLEQAALRPVADADRYTWLRTRESRPVGAVYDACPDRVLRGRSLVAGFRKGGGSLAELQDLRRTLGTALAQIYPDSARTQSAPPTASSPSTPGGIAIISSMRSMRTSRSTSHPRALRAICCPTTSAEDPRKTWPPPRIPPRGRRRDREPRQIEDGDGPTSTRRSAHRHRIHGHDVGLCPLPRSQIRSHRRGGHCYAVGMLAARSNRQDSFGVWRTLNTVDLPESAKQIADRNARPSTRRG